MVKEPDEVTSILKRTGLTYLIIIFVILFLNAVIGLIALRWAWNKSVRFRTPNTKLDALFPAYRRSDA